MILCGVLGIFEIFLILIVLAIILFPTIRVFLSRRENFTEKLDNLERLERMYRDGTLTKKQFERQKSRLLKRR